VECWGGLRACLTLAGSLPTFFDTTVEEPVVTILPERRHDLRYFLLQRFLLLALLFPAGTQSQETSLRFDRLSIADGLSENGVSCMLQDRRGFLWFGTLDGLNRYSGYGFHVFHYQPFDSSTISANRINRLVEDPGGGIWIGTNGGGLNFMQEGGSVRRFHLQSLLAPPHATDYITALCIDSSRQLWIGTLGGLFHWDVQHSRGTKVSGLNSDSILSLCVDRGGNLWIGSVAGVDVQRKEGGTIQKLTAMARRAGLRHLEVRSIAEDRQGRLWFGTVRSGLLVLDPATGETWSLRAGSPRCPGLNGDDIWDIEIGNEGMNRGVWIATANGLYWTSGFDKQRTVFSTIRNNPYDPTSLSGNEVWSLLLDREGILWVGTWQDGVSIRAPYKYKFRHLSSIPGTAQTLTSNNINALWEDRSGDVWVGTLRSGIDRLNRKSGLFVHLPELPRAGTDPSGWYHRCITSFAEEADGRMWVASWAGLFRFLPSGTVERHFVLRPGDSASLGLDMINVLLLDRHSRLWVGLRGSGLDVLDTRRQGKGFRHYHHVETEPSVADDMVWAIAEGPDGTIWVGTDRGLNHLDPSTAVWVTYRHEVTNPASLYDNIVHALWVENAGTVWVGTSAGLDRLDVQTGNFTHFTCADGLPSSCIYGIQPDPEGNLWLSTNRGLARFFPGALPGQKSRNFTTEDGLQGMEFCYGASHRGRSGMLYFGGLNGFNYFKPDEIKDNPHHPPIVITRLTSRDSSFLAETEEATPSHVTLEYPFHDFTIEFLALDYTSPKGNRYRYMLEGYDPTWIEAQSGRSASYTNIDAGTYVFAVQGSNADGVWSRQASKLTIDLRPPYWNTLWFKSLLALLGIGLLFALYRLRMERALAIERMRIRIASDLHDDIGSTLTKIAVQSEIIQSTDDIRAIRLASGKIGSASRSIIGMLSDIVWSIDARNDTVGDLLDRMREFATEVLPGSHVEYTFTVQGLEPERPIAVAVRQNLYLIFKEALTNIARHSTAHRATISLVNGPVSFTMRIANDGSRKGSESLSSHAGLKNMTMRARQIGGELATEGPPGFAVVLRRRKI
jgi:ligand-binding sensor domain-containing protein/signal transduction histidine kinase